MKSTAYGQGNNRNIPFIPQLFPVAKSTGERGNKGNNTYRLFPYSPPRFVRVLK
jgi:hypothetical protein